MATTNVQGPTRGIDKQVVDLLQKIDYLPPERRGQVESAYVFARQAHEGQFRKSGEPYVSHPLSVAALVADLRMDVSTILAALLHDVVEDCGVTLEEIEERYGPQARKLVDGVTKLGQLEWQEEVDGRRRPAGTPSQAENLRKMLLAMAEDVRVVIIKLADRLHNMRTLQPFTPDKRRRIARETMEIYAPLATRLGIWQFKWELEDLSFHHLEPEKYKEIAGLLASTRRTREAYIEKAKELLEGELQRGGIKAEVSGRPKHIYSIYQKQLKYAAQGRDIQEIYDLLALRVLVESLPDCYSALGVIHNLWRPLPGTFDDYISMPKDSGYQSLHTTIMAEKGQPLEVQIRTHEMHRVSEYGVAAHWRYKEGSSRDVKLEERLTWLRQLLEWQRDLQGAEEFVESVKTDLFTDRVFVYTPKGEIKDLPAAATPVDFAYRVHTDLGHKCVGAKVNGRLVPLNYTLKTGDMIEIVAGKGDRGPRLDWLNPELGYIRSTHAREKIRQWFRRQERGEAIDRGREVVRREVARLGLAVSDDEVAKLLKYEGVEPFLAAVGYGDVSTTTIANRLAGVQEPERPLMVSAPTAPIGPSSATGIRVMGVGGLLSSMATCCHPVPGDAIVGFITRTRGVTVHRVDCPNVVNIEDRDRLVKVDWGDGDRRYAVPVQINAVDRVGLLRDIASVVSSEGINIIQTYQKALPDGTAQFLLTMETTGMGQLSRVLARIEGVQGVTSASRAASPPPS